MDGDRKSEAHVHARGVELHLRVDELFDAGEGNDLVEAGFGFGARHAQDRGVEEHVLASRQILVETGTKFEQGGHAPAGRHTTTGRADDRPHDLEEGGLAGAVVAHETHGFVEGHVHAHVVKGAELFHPCARGVQHAVLDRGIPMKFKNLGNVLNADDFRH